MGGTLSGASWDIDLARSTKVNEASETGRFNMSRDKEE